MVSPPLPVPPAPGPWIPPHCLCGPQYKNQCKHTPSPLPRQTHVAPWVPSTPQLAHHSPPFAGTWGPSRLQPAPRSGCSPARNVLSTEPPAALRRPQGSAPPSFVLSWNELVPCLLRFPARVRRAGHCGRKAICARRQGGFHLRASLPLTQAALWGAGVPPFPAQCPPAQVPGPRSAGLWPSTPQQGGDGPGRRDPGAYAERAVARGSVTCCPPPPTHNTHPEEEARGCGWAGGEGIFLLREPSAHTPHPGDRTGRGHRSSGGRAEAEAVGWRGAAGTFAEEFSLLPRSWEPWERGRAVGRRTTGLDLHFRTHFRRWKEGWQLGGHTMAPRAGEEPVSAARPPAEATRAH